MFHPHKMNLLYKYKYFQQINNNYMDILKHILLYQIVNKYMMYNCLIWLIHNMNLHLQLLYNFLKNIRRRIHLTCYNLIIQYINV